MKPYNKIANETIYIGAACNRMIEELIIGISYFNVMILSNYNIRSHIGSVH